MVKRASLVIIFILINVACDRITKNIAVNRLDKTKVVQVVGDFFVLRYAENDGAFLSLGSSLPGASKPFLLTLLPILGLVAFLGYIVFAFVIKNGMTMGYLIALCSIVGGGIGNMIDRIQNDGRVVDFMNFGIGSLRTGILNVADLSITFGAIALFIIMMREKKKV